MRRRLYHSADTPEWRSFRLSPWRLKKLGNLTEKSFDDLWFSKTADDNRADIKRGDHPICWITCVSPLNQYLSYLTPLKFYKLLAPRTLAHILKKI